MEQLEKDLREKMVKVILISAICCFVLDMGFMIGLHFTSGLFYSVPMYFLRRILCPFSVNIVSYIFAKVFNSSSKPSGEAKNLACCMACCTLCGSMAIFHSSYTPLWVVPAMILLVSSVFHNEKMQRIILIYSCVLVVLAMVYVSSERPTEVGKYIEMCVAVEALNILLYMVANTVQKYQTRVQDLLKETTKSEMKYRMRLEKDTLTKVHSRVYIQEIVNKTFAMKDGKEQIGLAILDLDNFKRINDTYGHDNGDVVLERLGGLLNQYASDEIIVGRFGGEEFVIIFKGEDKEKYYTIVEEIRQKFSEYSFEFMKEKMTFSTGLVSCKSCIKYKTAFNKADEALYESKNNGKNKVTLREI